MKKNLSPQRPVLRCSQTNASRYTGSTKQRNTEKEPAWMRRDKEQAPRIARELEKFRF